MSATLAALYPWTKSLHLIFVIAWMAGLFYLPRIYVYHAEHGPAGSTPDAIFRTMEYRLLSAIMTPALIGTWVFGAALAMTPGVVDWSALWPWTKAAGVLAMTAFHGWLALRRRAFAAGSNTLSGRRYRMLNEVPTLLLIVIVFSVVLKF